MNKIKCRRCLEEKELNEFNNSKSARLGKQTICRECAHIEHKIYADKNRDLIRAKQRIYCSKNREKIKLRVNQFNFKFKEYKREAKRRNRSFTLTENQFKLFWQQNCFYCNSEIKSIGLDRIDSKLGYEINNIVPCCYICNVMKLDHSKFELYIHCIKIIENLKQNPIKLITRQPSPLIGQSIKNLFQVAD